MGLVGIVNATVYKTANFHRSWARQTVVIINTVSSVTHKSYEFLKLAVLSGFHVMYLNSAVEIVIYFNADIFEQGEMGSTVIAAC